MKTSLVKLSLLTVVGCTLTLTPFQSPAQEKKNENAAEKSGGAQGEAKKAVNPNRSLPLNGKVAAVDKSAKTVKVGNREFHVSAETKIQKDGKAATLEEITVGEPIRGSYRQAEDGKLNATSLFLGLKEAEAAKPAGQGEKSAKPNAKSDQPAKQTTGE